MKLHATARALGRTRWACRLALGVSIAFAGAGRRDRIDADGRAARERSGDARSRSAGTPANRSAMRMRAVEVEPHRRGTRSSAACSACTLIATAARAAAARSGRGSVADDDGHGVHGRRSPAPSPATRSGEPDRGLPRSRRRHAPFIAVAGVRTSASRVAVREGVLDLGPHRSVDVLTAPAPLPASSTAIGAAARGQVGCRRDATHGVTPSPVSARARVHVGA